MIYVSYLCVVVLLSLAFFFKTKIHLEYIYVKDSGHIEN